MTDADYMRLAIDLARKGEGWCHPNPLVGAVIVKDGTIIGQGWHARYGQKHAERMALEGAWADPNGATLYVTLEPCCHQGHQPPCTDAILEAGISRVVIGSRDPNPLVAGKGAAILRSRGVTVEEDFLRDECDALNPIFFHYITTKTPYVILKTAMTADGRIATSTGASKWITGEAARLRGQALRHRCMAILVGIGTALADDPLLTCRLEGGRSPIRLVCDSSLRLPADSQLATTARDIPVWDICAIPSAPAGPIEDADLLPQDLRSAGRALIDAGVRLVNFPGASGVDLGALTAFLGKEEVDSLLVEGGAGMAAAFVRGGLVDEWALFLAPKVFGGDGKPALASLGVTRPDQAPCLAFAGCEQVGDDVLLHLVRKEDDHVHGNS
jgi:diaminohydroxyphosphoribosylaminopyrimidine deaminase/5-amino-6-(5-phosphoribosylamino)uracil reductase